MSTLNQLVLSVLLISFFTACGETEESAGSPEQTTETIESSAEELAKVSTDSEEKSPAEGAAEFKSIEWVDLIPQDDLDALLNPPAFLAQIPEGSSADQMNGEFNNPNQTPVDIAINDRYQQALVSTQVVKEMDGQAVRIPGFVVPLEFDDDQVITHFFLVPFFGACIHVPPPPPNQIIYVHAPKGLKAEALYDPFWISGVLTTSLTEKGIGTSAYSLEMSEYEVYQ